MLHAHPFRVGKGRSIRIWIEDVADAAGHDLRWERSSADRNVFVAAAAGNGDLEPMRALLTQVAGGTVGVDRPSTPSTICTSCSTRSPGRESDWPLAPMKTASNSGHTPRM